MNFASNFKTVVPAEKIIANVFPSVQIKEKKNVYFDKKFALWKVRAFPFGLIFKLPIHSAQLIITDGFYFIDERCDRGFRVLLGAPILALFVVALLIIGQKLGGTVSLWELIFWPTLILLIIVFGSRAAFNARSGIWIVPRECVSEDIWSKKEIIIRGSISGFTLPHMDSYELLYKKIRNITSASVDFSFSFKFSENGGIHKRNFLLVVFEHIFLIAIILISLFIFW